MWEELSSVAKMGWSLKEKIVDFLLKIIDYAKDIYFTKLRGKVISRMKKKSSSFFLR